MSKTIKENSSKAPNGSEAMTAEKTTGDAPSDGSDSKDRSALPAPSAAELDISRDGKGSPIERTQVEGEAYPKGTSIQLVASHGH